MIAAVSSAILSPVHEGRIDWGGGLAWAEGGGHEALPGHGHQEEKTRH